MNARKEINNFGLAWRGIWKQYRSEVHFRFHCWAALAVIIMAVWLKATRVEWMILLGCIALVMVAETINTAIEKLTDLVEPQYNEQAGWIKDVASAAVLISAMLAAVIGLLVFVPKVF